MKNVKPRILAISGMKNSGKTTLIESILPRLSAAGLCVAVIKHDGHSFTPDTPGTDSYRFFAAGACSTAIFDSEKFSVTRRCHDVSEEVLIDMFPDAELILLEGFKNSSYPKINLVREGLPEDTNCDFQKYFAVVSDLNISSYKPVLRSDDLDAITEIVLQYARAASI